MTHSPIPYYAAGSHLRCTNPVVLAHCFRIRIRLHTRTHTHTPLSVYLFAGNCNMGTPRLCARKSTPLTTRSLKKRIPSSGESATAQHNSRSAATNSSLVHKQRFDHGNMAGFRRFYKANPVPLILNLPNCPPLPHIKYSPLSYIEENIWEYLVLGGVGGG